MTQKTVFYHRFSSREQALLKDENYLIDYAFSYAARNSISIDEKFIETCAQNIPLNQREQFIKMLSFMEENNINCISLYSHFSLSRDVFLYKEIINELNQKGITLIHMITPPAPVTLSEEMVAGILNDTSSYK